MAAGSPPRRIVVVGASLCGLSAAQALREEGFSGEIVLVVDEPEMPYDRPSLSKQVLRGRCGRDTALPCRPDLDLRFRLGTAAAGLDPRTRRVVLADGETIAYDRVLDTTGKGAVVRLGNGRRVETGCVLAALGAVRNVEWLAGAGLAVSDAGVRVDAECRALTPDGRVVPDVFAAGDLAQWPSAVYGGALLAVEHWEQRGGAGPGRRPQHGGRRRSPRKPRPPAGFLVAPVRPDGRARRGAGPGRPFRRGPGDDARAPLRRHLRRGRPHRRGGVGRFGPLAAGLPGRHRRGRAVPTLHQRPRTARLRAPLPSPGAIP